MLGFASRTEAEDWMLSHPESTLGAVHFTVNEASVPPDVKYTLQINTTVSENNPDTHLLPTRVYCCQHICTAAAHISVLLPTYLYCSAASTATVSMAVESFTASHMVCKSLNSTYLALTLAQCNHSLTVPC